jgi:hypothetical protein
MINERAYEKFKTQVNQIRTLEEARRHSAVGKMCTCGDCFCCAAQTGLAKFEKQADLLAEKFGKFETIDPVSVDKLIILLDMAPTLALEVIAAHNVKFAGKLAQSRINRRAHAKEIT